MGSLPWVYWTTEQGHSPGYFTTSDLFCHGSAKKLRKNKASQSLAASLQPIFQQISQSKLLTSVI